MSFFLRNIFVFLLSVNISCSLVDQIKKGFDGGGDEQPGSKKIEEEGENSGKNFDPLDPLEHISPEELKNFDDSDRLRLQTRDRSFEANLPSSGRLSLTDIQNLSFDPIGFTQCGDYGSSEKFTDLSEKLGGFSYNYRLRSETNFRNPIFVKEFLKDQIYRNGAERAAPSVLESESVDDAASDEFAVEIKRADLIGRFGDRVLYLSKVYGLFFVKLEESGPKLSCYLLQPGEAKNFYIHNGMVVLLINGFHPKNNSAIIRYKIEDSGLSYMDHHILGLQKIIDSRLFNDSLAVFSSLKEEVPTEPNESIAREAPIADVAISPYYAVSNNTMLTVLDLKENLDLKFEDVFLDQDVLLEEPLAKGEESIGKVDWRSLTYNQFISASDKYLVLSRTVNQRKITGIQNSSYSYWQCTDYQPQWRKYTYNHCRSVWEEIPNPDYDPNFSCADAANFFSCLLENEGKFIEATTVYKGKECKEHEYWRGKCLAREQITNNVQSFTYEWETSSEMIIYRFTPEGFTRIGDPASEDVLKVDGYAKEHKSFYFKNDHFYVVTTTNENDGFWGNRNNETALHTYAVGQSTLVKTHRLGGLGLGERLRAVLFEDQALYLVTYRDVDPLYAIDLSVPHTPILASELKIPGFSTQLILHNNKLIGIGRGDKNGQDGRTTHVKLSLFDVGNLEQISEEDSTLLGSESDNSYNNVERDDQLFHFQSSESRLFIPYKTTNYDENGKIYANEYVCRNTRYHQQNRISISSFIGNQISLDADFEVPVDIKRQIATDVNSALAFGETAVYSMKKEDQSWSINKVREEFTLESIYRDPSLPENMIVGQMVKNNGNQAVNLKFIMGTPEQLWSSNPSFTLDIPQEMLECLGRPQVRFLDNSVLVIFEAYPSSGQKQSFMLAWAFTNDGIKEHSKEETAKLAEEKKKYCKLKITPLPEDITSEQFDEIVKTVSSDDLECRTDYYHWMPIFCEFSGLRDYCVVNQRAFGRSVYE
ncbi:MAG: beta-propeller domain-containing protein [Oligoflexales bacterium]